MLENKGVYIILVFKKPDPIKAKILELIQCWSHAFKKNPNYKIVEDFYNAMKLEGNNYLILRVHGKFQQVNKRLLTVKGTNFRC